MAADVQDQHRPGAFADLYPRRGRVPWALQRLLPDPMRWEGRARYLHQDLETLADVEVEHELAALLGAIARSPIEAVPPWSWGRVRRLRDERRRRRAR